MVISIFEEETTTLSRKVEYQSFSDGDRQQRKANDDVFRKQKYEEMLKFKMKSYKEYEILFVIYLLLSEVN
jgi:hypothetical protein